MKKFFCLILAFAVSLGLFTGFGKTAASADADAGETTENKFVAAPLAVLEIDDENSLAEIDEENVDVAIMSFTLTGEIADKEGNALTNAAELATKLALKNIAMIYRIENSVILEAFKAYYEASGLKDAAVASSSSSVLIAAAEIKNLNVYYIAEDISDRDLAAVAITQANAFGAQTIILEGETNYDTVRYIQSRLKSVWVKTESDKVSAANALYLGGYGIVTPSVKNLNEVMLQISGAVKSENGYILGRSPYIVAHRGLTTVHSENTVGAIVDAAESGANHVEIDIRKTADGKIVLLHDDDIKYAMRNADGTAASGRVSNMTLAQLKALKMSDMTSEIATLDEVFEAALTPEARDLILLIEIKGEEAELINLFAEKISEYNIASRIAVISFYPAQILRVRAEIPEVPTAVLLYTTGGANAFEQAKAVKSGISMQFNGKGGMKAFYGEGGTKEAYKTAYEYFAKRGLPLWLWTYEADSMKEAVKNGVTGITTNDPVNYTANEVETLLVNDTVEVNELPANGSEVTIKARTYSGEEKNVTTTAVVLEESGDTVKAVLCYDSGVFGLSSRAVTFKKVNKGNDPSGGDSENSGNNGSSGSGCFGSVGGTAALCGLATVAMVILRKKREN